MKNTNIAFQQILEDVLGSNHVYFQPPTNKQLEYPCIVYSLSTVKEKEANNIKYLRDYVYSVTLIHRNPDNPVLDRLLDLKYSSLDKTFSTQGLYHYVLTIKYKNEKEIN